MSGVDVITFGCRLNTYESEVMKAQAEKAGLNNAILVNTCAVTGEAVRQARQAIRRARRDNPHARIIVTGCAAQTEKQTFAEMAEVDAVLGNEEKLASASYRSLPDFGVSAEEKLRVNDIMSVRATAPQMIRHIDGHVRAFIQVQNGCEQVPPWMVAGREWAGKVSIPIFPVKSGGLCLLSYRPWWHRRTGMGRCHPWEARI